MNIVSKIDDWQAIRKTLTHQKIGFVPTMGHLHAGHLSLCESAKRENDVTVMSIFVNPTQFNQKNDFEKYPRTLENDIELLRAQQIDYLFAPDEKSMYPDDYAFQLHETAISRELEGEFRPGHFNGMLTVVLKLLNLIQPSRAYFGEKDFQQLVLIKKMVTALFLPIEIISCETVRAEDGLALSSRNSRLNPSQREKATQFPELLTSAFSLPQIREQLTSAGFKVDYIAEKWGRRLGAVWLDDIRLIDNISLEKV